MAPAGGPDAGTVFPAFVLPAFSAATSVAAQGVSVTIAGDADMQVTGRLGQYLQALHQEIARVGATDVFVDVTGLKFISLSCLRQFATWFFHLAELDETKRYRVQLMLSPFLTWQKRSFDPFRYVAPGFVAIV